MSANVSDDKQSLRQAILAQRSVNQSSETQSGFTRELTRLVSDLGVRRIGCYLSFGSEPPTREFITTVQEAGIIVACPRIETDGSMVFAELGQSTEQTKLGFEQPLGQEVPKSDLELLVIPALAIDETGDRLGRGAGYFDRYLQNYLGITVGMIYESEFVSKLPTQGHDEPVNWVVTPTKSIALPLTGSIR
jgi:5-formyltetrahydrofolate cyclo-ligase